MAHHIFRLESELQNIPEAAPEASRSFSVSEKLALYGSSALSGVEHLTLLVGKKSVALALIRHFGSLKGLAPASFQELRQFLPRRQAESVVAALSMSVIAETEHARSEQLDNPGINLSSLRGYEVFQPRGAARHFAGHALPAQLDR
jgi:DNA repair protein RadC